MKPRKSIKESELEEPTSNVVTDNIHTSLGDSSEEIINFKESNSESNTIQDSILETLEDDNDECNDNTVIDTANDTEIDNKNIESDNNIEINKIMEPSNSSIPQENNNSDLHEDNLEEKLEEMESNDLEDITTQLSVNDNESKITLKKPNEVYYEIYKIAKDKAKQHKKAAISHYLEAKKIKNTYLLDDLDNSDESSEEEDSDSEKVKNEINEIVEELV